MRWLVLPLIAAAASGAAARAPKIPKDAPYCAMPGAKPLFVAPMGEPFRAAGAPAGANPAARWIAGADANGDGAVDRAEMAADARRFFQTLDKDRDGRLTPEEVIAYERDVAPEIAVYAGPRGDRLAGTRRDEDGYGGPRGAGRYSWLNIPQPVASADADMNRLVDAKEFVAAAARRFEALTAGRGVLRLADMTATPFQRAIDGPCWPQTKPRDPARPPARRAGQPER